MSQFQLLIGGELTPGASALDVVNPATLQTIAQAPRASAAQLDQAVAAAKAAFPAWSCTQLEHRRQMLNSIADVLTDNKGELARLLTQEQGKPLGDAAGEIDTTAGFFRYFAGLDLPVKVLERAAERRVEAHRRPLGVVGAITPWNFPLALMAFKAPPALLAGNTLVLKPAATTPLTILRLGELLLDVVPSGVINIISDANDLGALLTAHPDVCKISFTGSTATGAKVMAGAAATLKRVTLELGGNDAGIVLDDADPKAVAPALFRSAFRNSGQVCIAIKRLYVHESIYDDLCDELVALSEAAVVGDGLLQGTEFGPLQNKDQFERVKDLLTDAEQHGKVIAGGLMPEKTGYFIRPTLVRNISDGARLVDEEQFGPVLPVIKYSDPQDAVACANASKYGLGGSVWSSDPERAYALAEQLEAGTVWINRHGDLSPSVPFGGAKQSGLGVELGEEGLAEFTQLKVIIAAA